jgi:hypothetical protein
VTERKSQEPDESETQVPKTPPHEVEPEEDEEEESPATEKEEVAA